MQVGRKAQHLSEIALPLIYLFSALCHSIYPMLPKTSSLTKCSSSSSLSSMYLFGLVLILFCFGGFVCLFGFF